MKNFFLLLTLFIFSLCSHTALAIDIEEGVTHQPILPEQPPVSTSGKIEVIEIFWYGCPHCHRFQPTIERWLEDKADYVELIRMPAVLRPEWAIHARAYYTAEALGVLEDIHQPFFTAIHAHKRKLDTEASLMAFFAEHGVSEKDFKKTFRSFGVEGKLRIASNMARRYGVTGTPAIVVNGKYRTSNSVCKTCSMSDVMDIVDQLAEQEQHLASGGS